MSNNSYKYTRKSVVKQVVAATSIISLLVIGVGEYSVDKGLIKFAQGKPVGNIVKPLNNDGVTLKKFSEVPEIKKSIIFVEETDVEETYNTLLSVEEAVEEEQELPEINLMSVVVEAKELLSSASGAELENNILASYGLSSDYKVTLGDEVGVSSATKKLVTPGTPTGRDSTLLEVRNAAKHIDENYEGKSVKLSKHNRDLVERLVQGEAGAEGFIGAALVAQTIRDTMLEDNVYDLMTIKRTHGYSGGLTIEPNQEVLDAVAFIFDNGGYIVQHRLIYFYSPDNVKSSFHESQKFIIEHGGHRFFDEIKG